MAASFSAQVDEWIAQSRILMEVVFKTAAEKMRDRCIERLTQIVYAQPISPSGYKRTGFLRASLMASTTAMPLIDRKAVPSNDGSYPYTPAPMDAVIMGANLGDTIHFGMVAAYAAHVEFGARGVPPKSYIRWTIEQWPAVVNEAVSEVRARMGR